jgi:hypothetical protein
MHNYLFLILYMHTWIFQLLTGDHDHHELGRIKYLFLNPLYAHMDLVLLTGDHDHHELGRIKYLFLNPLYAHMDLELVTGDHDHHELCRIKCLFLILYVHLVSLFFLQGSGYLRPNDLHSSAWLVILIVFILYM